MKGMVKTEVMDESGKSQRARIPDNEQIIPSKNLSRYPCGHGVDKIAENGSVLLAQALN
jgi:hypothetical protein